MDRPVRQACDAFQTEQFRELVKSPWMIQELFDKLKAEAEATGNTGVDGGFWFRFSRKIGESILIQEENWEHFGDEKMLLLITDYLQGLFDFHNYQEKNENDRVRAPGFEGIQNAVLIAARLGFDKCFKYLIDNIKLQYFDADGIALASALQHNHSNILIYILMNLEEFGHYETYGSTGSLQVALQPKIKEWYRTSTIPDGIYKALWKLKIVK